VYPPKTLPPAACRNCASEASSARVCRMAILRIPVNITWSGSGSPGVNVFHGRVNDPINLTDAQGLVDAIRAFYVSLSSMTGMGSGGLHGGSAIATLGDVVDVESREMANVTMSPVTLAGGAGMAPAPVMAVVGWRTSSATRRGRGRTFIGPLNPGAVSTDGTLADSAVTGLRTAAQALVDASEGLTSAALGIYGLQSPAPDNIDPGSEAYRDLPRVLRDITGVRVRDSCAVLRSRRD
jgi:hypothetical protein